MGYAGGAMGVIDFSCFTNTSLYFFNYFYVCEKDIQKLRYDQYNVLDLPDLCKY